jgi:hypothetical protein
MAAYATLRQFYTYGLRRGVLVNEGRLVDSSLASTNVITLDGHLFETDDEVQVRASDGGTLSAPLAVSTTYYVIRLSDSTFSLAATAGGAAINLTSDGVSMIVIAELSIETLLEAYSRFADDFIPAHLVPLDSPYPVTVTRVVCELAAAKALSLNGQASVSMTEAEVGAKAQLERWAKGLPLRDATATASANKAISSTYASTESDPRGWGAGSGPLP